MSLRNNTFSAVCLLALSSGVLAAQEGEAAPAVTLSGNVAITSDYVFRGLTQNWGDPAIQGGLDVAFPHGFYAGVWGSNVSGKSYSEGSLEADLYAGWKGDLGGFTLQLGAIEYFYPGTNYDFDTAEALAGLSRWGFEAKASYSLTNYFALDESIGYREGSSGTIYLELNYSHAWESGLTLALHAGMTDLATELAAPLATGTSDPDYEDFAAKVGWDFAGPLALTGAWTHATNDDFYDGTASFLSSADTIDVGGDRFALTLTYSR